MTRYKVIRLPNHGLISSCEGKFWDKADTRAFVYIFATLCPDDVDDTPAHEIHQLFFPLFQGFPSDVNVAVVSPNHWNNDVMRFIGNSSLDVAFNDMSMFHMAETLSRMIRYEDEEAASSLQAHFLSKGWEKSNPLE